MAKKQKRVWQPPEEPSNVNAVTDRFGHRWTRLGEYWTTDVYALLPQKWTTLLCLRGPLKEAE